MVGFKNVYEQVRHRDLVEDASVSDSRFPLECSIVLLELSLELMESYMSISFAPASTANDAANWIDKVITRRRGRRMAAAANAIKHAGLIVSELRGLRDHMKSLFVPLQAFNPADWPPERRADHIQKLYTFSAVLPAFGYMTQEAYSLQSADLTELVKALPRKSGDEDPVMLRDGLVGLVWDVTHLGDSIQSFSDEDENDQDIHDRVTELDWNTELAEYARRGVEEEGDANVQAGPDMLIQYYLPALVWLVRDAGVEHMERVRALRKLSRDLYRTRTRSASASLELVVGEAERILGQFIGVVEKAYPDIPPATWASAATH